MKWSVFLIFPGLMSLLLHVYSLFFLQLLYFLRCRGLSRFYLDLNSLDLQPFSSVITWKLELSDIWRSLLQVLRDLLEFKSDRAPIPVGKVESASSIGQRPNAFVLVALFLLSLFHREFKEILRLSAWAPPKSPYECRISKHKCWN